MAQVTHRNSRGELPYCDSKVLAPYHYDGAPFMLLVTVLE